MFGDMVRHEAVADAWGLLGIEGWMGVPQLVLTMR